MVRRGGHAIEGKVLEQELVAGDQGQLWAGCEQVEEVLVTRIGCGSAGHQGIDDHCACGDFGNEVFHLAWTEAVERGDRRSQQDPLVFGEQGQRHRKA